VLASIEPLADGDAKLIGAHGDTVRFAVLLRNPSAAPIPFDRCPLMVELLAPAGRPQAHQLDCATPGGCRPAVHCASK
jgi:hypothetical protein